MLRNTNIIGAVSEAMVKGYLGSQGFEVFAPEQGHTRADLVYLDRSGKPVKVQIKTATFGSKSNTKHQYEQCVIARTHSGAYTKDEVDEFWIVGTHLWCFPFETVAGLIVVSLGTTNPNPRKTIRTYDPNDYIVVHGSLDLPYRERLFKDSYSPFLSTTNTEYHPETIRAMRYKKAVQP